MFHFFEAITNTQGDSLTGYFARLVNPTNLEVVAIYADKSGTPIVTVSGYDNMAKTDAAGNLSFFVAPGSYHIEIYGSDAATLFKRISDVPMYGDLTGSTGSTFVGYGTKTVAEALDEGEAFNRAFTQREILPVVLPMHFGAMLGGGWVGENGGGPDVIGQLSTTFTAPASVGAMSVTVADGSLWYDGQLMAYQATDTEWYTVRLRDIAGNTLHFKQPLPAAAASGASIGNALRDWNHPDEFGSYAFVDTCLRDMGYTWKLAHVQADWRTWRPFAPGGAPVSTVAAISALDYDNPGSDLTGLQAALLTSTVLDEGAQGLPVQLPAGSYRAVININPGYIDAATDTQNTVLVYINEEFAGGAAYVRTSREVVGFDGAQRVVVEFDISPKSRVFPIVQCKSAGTAKVKLGQVSYYRRSGKLVDFNKGLHVGLGNSWFENPWLLDRWEERFPDATLHRAGVAGNKIEDILDRFDSAIATAEGLYGMPVTLVLSDLGSTNDYAQNTPRSEFDWGVREFVRKSISLPAQPVLFDATVGSLTEMDGDPSAQLQNARGYGVGLDFHEAGEGEIAERTTAIVSGRVLAPGEKIAILCSETFPSEAAIIKQLGWFVTNVGVVITVGYSQSLQPPATLEDEIAFAALSAELRQYVVPKEDDPNPRIFMIAAENTTGSNQTIYASAAAYWNILY